jgi:hypothetical protein
MPQTEKAPERHGVPAEKRSDVKNPLQPDDEGLENQNLTRPAPMDVERPDNQRSTPDR